MSARKDCLEMFNRIVTPRQTNKSSMAFDVLKNRKTEIDFISGAVSKLEKKTWGQNSSKRSHV